MEVRLLLKATASNAVPARAEKLEDGEYDVVSDLSDPGERRSVRKSVILISMITGKEK